MVPFLEEAQESGEPGCLLDWDGLWRLLRLESNFGSEHSVCFLMMSKRSFPPKEMVGQVAGN